MAEDRSASLGGYLRAATEGYRFGRGKIALLAGALCAALAGGVGSAFDGDRSSTSSHAGGRRPAATTPGAGTPTAGRGFVEIEGGPRFPDIWIPTPLPSPPGSAPGDAPPGGSAPSTEGDPPGTAAPSRAPAPGSTALLRGGFGFLVGFCIGFALRTVVRLVALVAGAQLVLLLVFATLGWIEVHWEVMGAQVQGWLDHLGPELSSFESFLRGQLLSAGIGLAGLYTGLRKS